MQQEKEIPVNDKESRHSRNASVLECYRKEEINASDEDDYNSMSSSECDAGEECSLQDIKPSNKKLKEEVRFSKNKHKHRSLDDDSEQDARKKQKLNDDTLLLDEFLEYLINIKCLSATTSRKHFNNMQKICKRKVYFGINSLEEIPKNYESISKHELVESHHRTSIDYFNNFLEYKFPVKTVSGITCSITFNNVPYKEGMTFSFTTK
jgi:hypothetical protein